MAITYVPRPMPTLGGDAQYLQQELANISQSIKTITAQDSWHPLPYVNGWVDFDTNLYGPAGYRKLSNGLVVLRGLVKNGSAAGIATLPAGYRPGIQLLFCVYTSPNTPCRMDISTAGGISHTGGSSVWISLDGITFIAEK